MRTLTAATLAVACLAAGRAPAQPEIEPKDGKVTYAVTLHPADYPRPVSRVYLLPEFGESIPGNRVQMFLRCFMEQDNFFGRAESEKRDKWNHMPLRDLPAELRTYGGRLVDRDMYDAARMTNVDWQLWYFARRDGYKTLLPDVQKMRSIANVLKTRARGEIAARDFDGAVRTLKTFFGLARTLEAQPTLIGHLVGAALAMIGVEAVEELIQQPGCPNLYWALTDLPVPFISLRAGLEGERMFISHDFEALKTADDPVSDAAILKKIEEYHDLIKLEDVEDFPPGKPATRLKALLRERAGDAGRVKAARGRLILAGLKAERVAKWSPLHVVVIDEVVTYEIQRDELCKWYNLPYWVAKPGIDAFDAEFAKVKASGPFLYLVPALLKVKLAQGRLDQRLAYLRVLEAIRLHARGHGGALPTTLEEIKLPLPVDPISGKAFEYGVNDGVATLHGANPQPGAERLNRYYEIRIAK